MWNELRTALETSKLRVNVCNLYLLGITEILLPVLIPLVRHIRYLTPPKKDFVCSSIYFSTLVEIVTLVFRLLQEARCLLVSDTMLEIVLGK
jgi:hypothetical protein